MPSYRERVFHDPYMSRTSDLALTSIAGALIAVSLILIGAVVHWRDVAVIRAASPVFLVGMLLGSILMYLSVFSGTLEARTPACHVRIWLLGLGFILLFGSLVLKTYRVARLLDSGNMAIYKISDFQLLLVLFILLSMQIVLLTIASAVLRPVARVVHVDPNRAALNLTVCFSTHQSTPILAIFIAYNGLICLAGVLSGILVWNVRLKTYNEVRPRLSCFLHSLLDTNLRYSLVRSFFPCTMWWPSRCWWLVCK